MATFLSASSVRVATRIRRKIIASLRSSTVRKGIWRGEKGE
jgi:hypothetical protein